MADDDNFITPVGIQRVQYELEFLRNVERPEVVAEVSAAAELGDRSENAAYIYGKKRLRQIDGRLGFLITSLHRLRVIDPARLVGGERVAFGATVQVEDEEGRVKTWRIYGQHEVDISGGILSHLSPIAKAMMGKSAGDGVTYRTPGGLRELEILEVHYAPQEPLPVPEWKRKRDEA